ncbi:hypothetical protein A3I48_03710 [Candidatus Daviesbacteria bacterium RIFCSPLOWO2_02_FULL_36_7]|uniref:GIY-YIG domain-containing protein n=1 Tax=Candidatus Daviesbacteria bacterium RIFCSPLOWO2_02_FULL_36_7 TaxID=1797792 RepID=A0A1F5MG10_9BACT|nr:MAG: hypothetical protein A3I48_03710 [Candidatus Daviesbacteria bacterium RIFCSPLOWO2_02_FULL_36_7]
MAIQWYKRSDSFLRDTAPRISFRKEHIGYNAVFVKVANLNQYNRVRIGIDYDTYEIYFQFLSQDENDKNTEGKFTDTLACYPDNPNDLTKSTGAQKLYEHNALLRNLSEDENHRQFAVQQNSTDPSLWFAQLHPTFEYTVKSNADPKSLRGIYRYLNNRDVVYIGKGVIESRLNSPQRTKWVYDTIEYSIVNDSQKQFEFEHLWIERYKEEHNGKLPFYNQNSGRGH